jgi:hypothetical protein
LTLLAKDPTNFTGACVRQVQIFLQQEFQPAVKEYLKDVSSEKVQLDV